MRLIAVSRMQAPIMRGTVIEMVAQPGRISFLLTSESGAKEMHWVNGQAMPRPYRCLLPLPSHPGRRRTPLCTRHWKSGPVALQRPYAAGVKLLYRGCQALSLVL